MGSFKDPATGGDASTWDLLGGWPKRRPWRLKETTGGAAAFWRIGGTWVVRWSVF